MRSLVIQTSFLGDMVLTTPLIAYLAEGGAVDVVATPAAAALLANHPSVSRMIVYDKRRSDRGPIGFTRLAGALRAAKYDAAYMAQGSMRSAALALVSGIGTRIGFASSAGRALYTERLPYIETDHHAARLLSLARRDRGVASTAPRPRLYPGAPERAEVDALLGSVGSSRPLVAIAPGSVWATKRWPGYSALAARLRSRGTVVIVGSSADHEIATEIMNATGGEAIDATGKLTLLGSAELIGRAKILVTNDYAPQHLASAMNTPTVTIFGPTVPQFGFGPLADRRAVVGVDELSCRPCDRHGPMKCPLGHWKCMREVGVDRVLTVLDELTRSPAD
jgi:heptosyltransferase II